MRPFEAMVVLRDRMWDLGYDPDHECDTAVQLAYALIDEPVETYRQDPMVRELVARFYGPLPSRTKDGASASALYDRMLDILNVATPAEAARWYFTM